MSVFRPRSPRYAARPPAFVGGVPAAYELDLAPASVTLTTQPIGPLYGAVLDLAPASVTLTTQSVDLSLGSFLDLAPTSVALTTQAADLFLGTLLDLAPASLTLTPVAIDLVYTGNPELDFAPASVALTPQSIDLLGQFLLDIAPASVTLTPASLGLENVVILDIDPTTLSATPVDVGLLHGAILDVATTSLALTPVAADLLLGAELDLAPASVALTPVALDFVIAHAIVVAPASVTLAPVTVTMAGPSPSVVFATHIEFRETLVGGAWTRESVAGTSSAYFIHNLTPDTQYDVRVLFENGFGEGPPSTIETPTTYAVSDAEGLALIAFAQADVVPPFYAAGTWSAEDEQQILGLPIVPLVPGALVQADFTLPMEALTPVSFSQAVPYESGLGTLSGNTRNPMEGLAVILSVMGATMEAGIRVLRVDVVVWESETTLTQTTTGVYEALSTELAGLTLPMEALQHIAAAPPLGHEAVIVTLNSSTLPYEGGRSGVSLDGSLSWESLGSLAFVMPILWESLGLTQRAIRSPWESRGVLIPILSAPWESMGGQTTTGSTPWESIGQAIGTGQLPLEAQTLLAVILGGPYEGQSMPELVVLLPWEARPVSSGGLARIPYEGRGFFAQPVPMPWESVSSLLETVGLVHEGLIRLDDLVAVPYEGRQGFVVQSVFHDIDGDAWFAALREDDLYF